MQILFDRRLIDPSPLCYQDIAGKHLMYAQVTWRETFLPVG
jgi:hypothetical protein